MIILFALLAVIVRLATGRRDSASGPGAARLGVQGTTSRAPGPRYCHLAPLTADAVGGSLQTVILVAFVVLSVFGGHRPSRSLDTDRRTSRAPMRFMPWLAQPMGVVKGRDEVTHIRVEQEAAMKGSWGWVLPVLLISAGVAVGLIAPPFALSQHASPVTKAAVVAPIRNAAMPGVAR